MSHPGGVLSCLSVKAKLAHSVSQLLSAVSPNNCAAAVRLFVCLHLWCDIECEQNYDRCTQGLTTFIQERRTYGALHTKPLQASKTLSTTSIYINSLKGAACGCHLLRYHNRDELCKRAALSSCSPHSTRSGASNECKNKDERKQVRPVTRRMRANVGLSF
jgi:hypothetical protein